VEILDEREKQTPAEEYADLKTIFDQWPAAVPPEMICDIESEEDKTIRAEEITSNFINTDLKHMRFLDCGCGEGHLARHVAQKAAFSVGYDIALEKTKRQRTKKLLLTSSFEEVKDFAPYDYIMLFDALDHCSDPLQLLKDLKSISKANTIIKIRCHPHASRHGGHQYRTLNLAYLHLVLRPEELKKHGLEPDVAALYSELDYRDWFEKIEAQVTLYRPVKMEVEHFFQIGLVKKRLFDHGISDFSMLDTEFIDFELTFRKT
jgi:SAM-dependent methyltransferase